MSFRARRYCFWRDLFRLEFFTDRAREEIDGGMKPQDLGAFIDKDDGGEFTCGSVECKEEPQFYCRRQFQTILKRMFNRWKRDMLCVATENCWYGVEGDLSSGKWTLVI